VDYSILKIIIVLAVTAIVAFFFGYSLSAYNVFRSVATAVFLSSLIVLLPILIKQNGSISFPLFVVATSLGISISLFSKTPFVVTGVLFFINGFLAESLLRGRAEIVNSLKVNFLKLSGRVLSGAFTVIALSFAVGYGWNFKTDDLFSEKFLDGALFVASPLINYYSPGFSPEMELRDFLNISARRLLLENDPDFTSISEPVKRNSCRRKSIGAYRNA